MTFKVCLTSFVFGDYKRYIPFYCYSALKSYPEYFVRIFVDGKLGDAERKCIDDIRANVSGSVEVIDHAFEGFDLPLTPRINRGQKMFLRWLFEGSDFAGFDCVYFSDIDFLVLRQEPTLVEFHVQNAEQFGVPFSNMVRADKTKTGQPPNRLTGCHFVLAEPYFNRTDEVIRQIKADPGLITDLAPNATSNEHFLYELVQRAIPFNGNALRKSLRPVPGPHLGVARSKGQMGAVIAQLDSFGPDGNPAVCDMRAQIAAFCRDPVFLRTLWTVKVPEVAIFLAQLGVVPSELRHKLRVSSLVAGAGLQRWHRRVANRLGVAHTA